MDQKTPAAAEPRAPLGSLLIQAMWRRHADNYGGSMAALVEAFARSIEREHGIGKPAAPPAPPSDAAG